MPEAVRTLLVGYGNAGRNIHAPFINASKGLELAGIVSSRAEAIQTDLPGMTVVATLEEGLKLPGVELVMIASPTSQHAANALTALDAGKHVLVDKPFAATAEAAQGVADHARKVGKIATVFQNRRWDSHIRTVKTVLDAGKLGPLSEVILRYDRLIPVAPARWRDQDLPGSGIWYDLGAHLIDQSVYLFGKPQTIMADIFAQRPGAMNHDYFNVILGYGSFRVIVNACMLTPLPGPVIEAHGQHGSFVKVGQDTQEVGLMARQTPGGPGWGDDPAGAVFVPAADFKAGAKEQMPCLPGDYLALYEGMAKAVRGEAPPPVPMEDSILVIKLLEMAVQSAAEGRRLAV
jgi:scyllo-inositol 2-dehydrogenase (NADP+)